jgi:hypothetical protein
LKFAKIAQTAEKLRAQKFDCYNAEVFNCEGRDYIDIALGCARAMLNVV